MTVFCAAEACGDIARARGWCDKHYRRWKKRGSVAQAPERAGPGEAQEFFRIALQYDGDACLLWPYARLPKGYAQFIYEGRAARVHRVICEHVNGPPPTDEHQARHLCGGGNVGCVAPKHLAWGTNTENCQDTIRHGRTNKGRPSAIRGSLCAPSKFTDTDVAEIRKLLAKEQSGRSIARQFGVTPKAIFDIKYGKTWAWLERASCG